MAYDIGRGLASLGAAWGGAGESIRKDRSRRTIGDKLRGENPDYAGAASAAIDGGDLNAGINILALAQKERERQAGAQAASSFLSDMGGIGGMFGASGGPQPQTLADLRVASSSSTGSRMGASGLGSLASIPSFTRAAQEYGLPSSYLPVTASIESNGNPNAVSSTGARGPL